jgi:hypothetical protein
MKIKFEISPKKEAENLPNLIKLAGREIIDPKFRGRLMNKSGKKLYLELVKIHKEQKLNLIHIKELIGKNWKKVEKNYIKELGILTGQKIKQNKIVIIAPTINGAIADVIRRKNVFIGTKFNDKILNYIAMHEITHLHYVDIVDKFKLTEAWKSPLMEGVDHILLFRSPIRRLVNSKIKYRDIQFVHLNSKFMNSLERVWKARKDFKHFLEQAIILQNYFAKKTNIKIC